jgi:hypothetical protein
MDRLNELMKIMDEMDVHEDPLCTTVAGRQALKKSAMARVKNIHKKCQTTESYPSVNY